MSPCKNVSNVHSCKWQCIYIVLMIIPRFINLLLYLNIVKAWYLNSPRFFFPSIKKKKSPTFASTHTALGNLRVFMLNLNPPVPHLESGWSEEYTHWRFYTDYFFAIKRFLKNSLYLDFFKSKWHWHWLCIVVTAEISEMDVSKSGNKTKTIQKQEKW